MAAICSANDKGSSQRKNLGSAGRVEVAIARSVSGGSLHAVEDGIGGGRGSKIVKMFLQEHSDVQKCMYKWYGHQSGSLVSTSSATVARPSRPDSRGDGCPNMSRTADGRYST